MDIYRNEMYNTKKILEKLTDIHQELLDVIKKPENRFTKVLKYFILIVSALGILHFVELVRQWIIGG